MFCFVDYRISDLEKNTLEKLNLDIIKIPKCDTLYDAINGHVDIQVHILDKESKTILINKNMPVEFKKNLSNLKIKFIESYSDLGKSYPFNIGLNAFSINNYFIHNLKHTDKNLLSFQESKELINVKQGYTKCSCLPISENAFITNDKGLYKSLIKYNFDSADIGAALLADYTLFHIEADLRWIDITIARLGELRSEVTA